jgi:hypothetical protein
MNHSVIEANGRKIEVIGKKVYIDDVKMPYVKPKFFNGPTCAVLGFVLGMAFGVFLMGGFVV